jgi:hydroxymethylbilane synthase
VHSYKDVPVTMPLVDQSELIIAAVPKREDPSDVLMCAKARSIEELPKDARVGTGSLRRKAQLMEHRPDLIIQGIRGNIDTRLRKLRDGECDALILAAAGLKRCGLFDALIMSPLTNMLPAAGQGALAIQCRKGDVATQKVLVSLDDSESRACVDAERAIVAGLNGDCHSPIAALATVVGGDLHLRAAVAAREGELPIIHAESVSPADHAAHAVDQILDKLRRAGADKLLHGID